MDQFDVTIPGFVVFIAAVLMGGLILQALVYGIVELARILRSPRDD